MRSILGLALLVPSVALAQPAPAAPRAGASPALPEAAAAAPEAAVDPAVATEPPVRVAAIVAPSAAASAGCASAQCLVAPAPSDGSPAVRPPSAAPLLDPEATAAMPAAAAGPIGLHRRLAEDAAAGRTYFTDTALTAPRGSVAVSLRAPTAPVAELQLRYSIHDRIELGAGGGLIASGGPGNSDSAPSYSAYSFHAKAQLWRNDRAAVAVGVSRYAITEEGDHDAVTIPTLVASTCLDGAACTALVSLSLNGFVIDGEDDVPIFAGLGWALGRKIQFVGELHYSNDDQGDSLSFGYIGLRGAGGRLAVDGGIGFVSEGNGGCADCSADTEAFPFVGVATRM